MASKSLCFVFRHHRSSACALLSLATSPIIRSSDILFSVVSPWVFVGLLYPKFQLQRSDPIFLTLFFLYKSGQTVASDFFKGIRYFKKLSADIRHSNVVYGGDESYTRENTRVISWRDLPGYEQPVMEELYFSRS